MKQIRETIKRNILTALLREESIKTTITRAKHIRGLAEKIIHIAKENSLTARRRVSKIIKDANILKKLFSDIAPRFKERNGGYTRIIKIGFRHGDCAPMSILELVEKRIVKKTKEEKKQEKEKKLKEKTKKGLVK
jgi:large subunit ribosomal protein L17